MSPRQIALTAALMALQAALLFLMSASDSQAAAEVYRCGNSYQAQPCPQGPSSELLLAKEPSADQRKQAQTTLEREQRATRQMERSNRAWARAHGLEVGSRIRPSGSASDKPSASVSPQMLSHATALGCARRGRRPFEACTHETPHQAQKRASQEARAAQRARRAFVARAPQTAQGTGQSALAQGTEP